MTSKIKVDNINKVSDDSNIIKKCGTTTTIGSGASNPIVVDGSAVTLGRCGGTVALASGATQTGFGRTGTVDWQTTPKTATFTAVSGEGYFCNTTSSAFTVNLPAGSAGAIVSLADYAATWQTNNLTVVPNGTDKIGSLNSNAILSTEGQSVTFVFVDSTQGWINTMDSTSNVRGASFITATGGTITCSGDYKIHTFTGPGTFCVSNAGNPAGSNTVDYMVVAGGGAGGGTLTGTSGGAGGGGAGGFRESSGVASGSYTVSPLGACVSALPVSVQGYSIVVGAGGAGNTNNQGSNGGLSSFSTITSAGGGGGGSRGPTDPSANGLSGGSGGGSGHGTTGGSTAGGAGNTPPVSPPQGNAGQAFPSGPAAGGGGGGAGAASADANGGNGVTNSINATPTARAGGGGGANGGAAGSGGSGGGGAGNAACGGIGAVGTINTGSGGGGSGDKGGGGPSIAGGAGGSGIVIIRYKFQ
jgi:hypothetical protein